MALNETDTTALRDLAHKVDILTAQLHQAKTDRDHGIRIALELGAFPTEVTRATSLTRARIYQIKSEK